LQNTRGSFFGRIKNLFGSKPSLSAGELDDLEEILYTSDLGPQTVQRLLHAVETKLKTGGGAGFEAVRTALKTEMLDIFAGLAGRIGTAQAPTPESFDVVANAQNDYIEGLEKLNIWNRKPAILMVIGVNGAGKTTTIGKLSRRIAQSGRKVLVAAGDTFRAAAGDQLKVWTERAQVEIFSPENVSDPSAVAYQAIERGKADGADVVIIDTAGRLHTQSNLMEELKKMQRVMTKLIPDAPHEVLLVLDANSGQNALIQAREFNQALGVTGVVLTKLDGTAKGGVAVGLACELGLPIKLIGVGEGIEDLRRFSAQEFVDSII
jgi:fused signal recognition particle receptor